MNQSQYGKQEYFGIRPESLIIYSETDAMIRGRISFIESLIVSTQQYSRELQSLE